MPHIQSSFAVIGRYYLHSQQKQKSKKAKERSSETNIGVEDWRGAFPGVFIPKFDFNAFPGVAAADAVVVFIACGSAGALLAGDLDGDDAEWDGVGFDDGKTFFVDEIDEETEDAEWELLDGCVSFFAAIAFCVAGVAGVAGVGMVGWAVVFAVIGAEIFACGADALVVVAVAVEFEFEFAVVGAAAVGGCCVTFGRANWWRRDGGASLVWK